MAWSETESTDSPTHQYLSCGENGESKAEKSAALGVERQLLSLRSTSGSLFLPVAEINDQLASPAERWERVGGATERWFHLKDVRTGLRRC